MQREVKEIGAIQSYILEMAKDFHRVMSQNAVPYYMSGGTMLGAIRHKGFIPWDDDMDFGVPRVYYNKAIEILKTELDSRYRIVSSDQGLTLSDTSKIEDLRTEIIEEARDESLAKTGLFIDIFPIDSCNNNSGFFSRNSWITRLMSFNQFKYIKPKKFLYRIIAIPVRLLPQNTLLKIARKILFDKGDFVTNYSGLYGKKEIMPRGFYGTPTLYKFEDTSFYGVENYDSYLKALYGDYMTLPPIEKRHTHNLTCYVKE